MLAGILAVQQVARAVLAEAVKVMAALQQAVLAIPRLSVLRRGQMAARDMPRLRQHPLHLAVVEAQVRLVQMQHQLQPVMVETAQHPQSAVHLLLTQAAAVAAFNLPAQRLELAARVAAVLDQLLETAQMAQPIQEAVVAVVAVLEPTQAAQAALAS